MNESNIPSYLHKYVECSGSKTFTGRLTAEQLRAIYVPAHLLLYACHSCVSCDQSASHGEGHASAFCQFPHQTLKHSVL